MLILFSIVLLPKFCFANTFTDQVYKISFSIPNGYSVSNIEETIENRPYILIKNIANKKMYFTIKSNTLSKIRAYSWEAFGNKEVLDEMAKSSAKNKADEISNYYNVVKISFAEKVIVKDKVALVYFIDFINKDNSGNKKTLGCASITSEGLLWEFCLYGENIDTNFVNLFFDFIGNSQLLVEAGSPQVLKVG